MFTEVKNGTCERRIQPQKVIPETECVCVCVCVCVCRESSIWGCSWSRFITENRAYFLFVLFPNPNHVSDCHLLGLGLFKSISEPGSKPGRPTVSQKLTSNYTQTLCKHSNKLQSPYFSLVGFFCVCLYLSQEKGAWRWAGAQQGKQTAVTVGTAHCPALAVSFPTAAPSSEPRPYAAYADSRTAWKAGHPGWVHRASLWN